MARPISGTTDFTNLDGVAYSATGSTTTASNLDGWDFVEQLTSSNDGNQYVQVEQPSSAETVDAYTDNSNAITYLSVKPNDSSLFTLNSIGVVLSGYDAGTTGGNVELVGYLNGSPVAGATLTQNVGDVLQGGGSPVTFTVSGNANFQGIDSFRVMAAPGHAIFGMVGIGAINATSFGFATVLTPTGGTVAFVAGDNTASTPVVVDNGITVSDADSATLASATVSITGNFHSGEDVLAFTNNPATEGNISGSYNSGTGVLTLTSSGASATLAQWQAALRAITYTDTAVTPSNANRTITFAANDGTNTSTSVTRIVTVTDTNQTPIVTTSGGTSAFVAGDNTASAPVVIDGAITVSDLDNTTLSSATVTITGGFQSGQDVLAFTNDGITEGNISASYNGSTGTLTLASSGGTATLPQWQAALRSVTYTDTATTPNTTNRTISFVINDGSANSSATTHVVTVAATDQTPIVTTSGGTVAFVAGDNTASTPVAIGSGLTVADADNTSLVSATVSLTANFQSGEDQLSFTNNPATNGNITGSYGAGTGILTLTSAGGTATLAQWQAALRAITYTDTAISPNTATRTVSVAISDGTKTSATATRSITVAATDQTPLLTSSGGNAAFVEPTTPPPLPSSSTTASPSRTSTTPPWPPPSSPSPAISVPPKTSSPSPTIPPPKATSAAATTAAPAS